MQEQDSKPRRELDIELDRFEQSLTELKIQYEQHFIDILPQPPEQLHKDVVKHMRRLLNAPFKNSANRFRLKMLAQRYQSYNTYWERVKKQREDGTYSRDRFRSKMREKMSMEDHRRARAEGRAEKEMTQLYKSYEDALRKTGARTDKLNYESFKRSLVNNAKEFKKLHGAAKLSYKVTVKDGKVSLKASVKDKG